MRRSLLRSISVAIALDAIGVRVGDSSAQSSTPVVVQLLGPRSVLVEVAAGVVQPCDSISNRQLYRAKMAPGDTVTLQSPTTCICWRQTYDNFPDANWSRSRTKCMTGTVCQGRHCVRDPDPVLRLSLSSTEPHP
jgi:hypothetical protein